MAQSHFDEDGCDMVGCHAVGQLKLDLLDQLSCHIHILRRILSWREGRGEDASAIAIAIAIVSVSVSASVDASGA